MLFIAIFALASAMQCATLDMEVYYRAFDGFAEGESHPFRALLRTPRIDVAGGIVGDTISRPFEVRQDSHLYYLPEGIEPGDDESIILLDVTIIAFAGDAALVTLPVLPRVIPITDYEPLRHDKTRTKYVAVRLCEDDGTVRYDGFRLIGSVDRKPVLYK